jgi:hypothetical protein
MTWIAFAIYVLAETDELRVVAFLTMVAFIALALGTSLVLANWRFCDRCQRPLFADKNLMSATPMIAIMEGAVKGRARCNRCGHADGAKVPTE